jgi:hypothetical protein
MKADREVKIGFTTEHDGRGADEANKKIDETKKKAGEAAGGFGKLGQSITLVKGVMEKVNAVFMGLGIIGVITTAVNLVRQLHEWINKSKTRTAELAEEAKKAAEVKAVEALSDQYKRLSDNIKLARDAAEDMRKISDIHLGNMRGLEDAQSALDEDNEIGEVKKDDPDKAVKEDAIRKKYARRRALTAVSRKKEDLVFDRQELLADAAAAEAEAEERESALSDDDALADKTRRRLAMERQRSNAKKPSRLKLAVSTAGLAGRLASEALPDMVDDVEVQDKARKEIPVLEERLKKLEDGIAAKEGEIAAARRKAESGRKTAAALGGGFEALSVAQKFEDKSGRRGMSEAQDAIDKAAAERERERRDLEQARRDKAAAEARKGHLEAGLSAAKGAADTESQEAWRARNALDAHESSRPSGGGGKKYADAGRALQAAWEREQAEANAAVRAAETLGEATAKSMETVNGILSKSASRIKAIEAKFNKDAYGDNGTGG